MTSERLVGTVAGAGALGAALVALPVEGVVPAAQTLAILAPLGAAATLAARAVLRRRDAPLHRRAAALGVVVGAALVAGTVAFVALMFVSAHDAFFGLLIAAYTGLLGVCAGALLTRAALEDIAEEEHARRDLIAAVSHDLRTPLTALRLLVEAVDDEVVDGAQRREYLERLGPHVRQLGALVDDLFELSRIEARELRWELERVSLTDVVAEAIDAMRPEAEARSVRVAGEVSGPEVAACVAPEQLQRVLLNLIRNAIRHTPPDGSVTVRAVPRDAGVEIEVSDTGEGIAAGDRDRVFEPFVRGRAHAARSDDGAGLGLAIARAIVEAHGGRIWLDDAVRGTRIRFSLPA